MAGRDTPAAAEHALAPPVALAATAGEPAPAQTAHGLVGTLSTGRAAARHRVRRHSALTLLTQSELSHRCMGWDGNAVFRLENGEVWRQSDQRSRSFHASCPRVRIFQFLDGHVIEIEGSMELFAVRRVLE